MRIQSVRAHVGDNSLQPHPGTAIDQRQLVSPVQNVHVTIKRIGYFESVPAAANQIYSLGQLHSAPPPAASVARISAARATSPRAIDSSRVWARSMLPGPNTTEGMPAWLNLLASVPKVTP